MPRKSLKADVPPGYSVDESAGPMLRFQKSLPRLPVPALSSTLHKYLETVQPHLTPDEFAKTSSAIKAFGESAFGAELQKRLEARRAEPGMKNWLADWWNDVAYMSYRDPVVVYVSYFYVHNELGQMGAAERAARLVKALLPFRELVETGRLEPEYVRTAPLCMDSYKWLFNSSRYPTKPADTARKFDPGTHDHIVFVRKNRFFEVQLAQDGRPLSLLELEQQISKIIAEAGQEPDGFPVGVLTSENRDTWTEARDHIVANPQNAKALERIESAVVIVCLDDTKPTTREDLSWACWTGDGRNRWYDKHQCEWFLRCSIYFFRFLFLPLFEWHEDWCLVGNIEISGRLEQLGMLCPLVVWISDAYIFPSTAFFARRGFCLNRRGHLYD